MKKKILIWIGCAMGLVGLAVAVTFGMLELADNPADKEVSAEIDTRNIKQSKRKGSEVGELW